MGERRDRLDKRAAKQIETRRRNALRKAKQRARRAERQKAKAERLAKKLGEK